MFKFKLDSVLNYRRRIEDLRQQELAQCRTTWENEKKRLEHYQTLWRTCLDQWRSLQSSSVAILEVELYQRYMLKLREEIRLQADKVRECLEALDAQRDRVLQARKDRKMIEKLHEYALIRHRTERARHETRFLDETAAQRYVIRKPLT